MHSLNDLFGQDPFLTLCAVLIGIIALWGAVFAAVIALCKAAASQPEVDASREFCERTGDEPECDCPECQGIRHEME